MFINYINIQELLDFEIIKIGSKKLLLVNIVTALCIVLIAYIFQFVVRKLIYRAKHIEPSKKYSIYRLFQYFYWVIVALIAIESLGFNVSVILAGSAALLVGFGLGMQHLFSDFVSGIILLSDGTLKVNDVIEVNDKIYKVQEINFRTTTVIGRDENYIIVPNSELTGNRIINWTYKKEISRFKVELGVSYSTNVDEIMKIMVETAAKNPLVLRTPVPFARLEEYADSSVNYAVYFWSAEVFRIEQIKSEIRVSLFKKLAENKIEIPFPQRVIHNAKPDK
jgi:small-conductance mechanosensitive channel